MLGDMLTPEELYELSLIRKNGDHGDRSNDRITPGALRERAKNRKRNNRLRSE